MNASEHRTTVVLPADLRDRLLERAEAADRTLSAEIRVAIREHVALDAERSAQEKAAA